MYSVRLQDAAGAPQYTKEYLQAKHKRNAITALCTGPFLNIPGMCSHAKMLFLTSHQALVSVARFELSSCIYVTGLDFNDQELDNQGKGISFVVCGCSSGLLSKLLLVHILFDQ